MAPAWAMPVMMAGVLLLMRALLLLQVGHPGHAAASTTLCGSLCGPRYCMGLPVYQMIRLYCTLTCQRETTLPCRLRCVFAWH